MEILYVDESGDPGHSAHSSDHFILSGLTISQDDWDRCFQEMKLLRKHFSTEYGLNQRTEIHAAELIRINKLAEYKDIRKSNRLRILREFSAQIPLIFRNSKVINICLKKSNFELETDLQELAWKRLIQRFDNYLKKSKSDKGIIISDDTDGKSIVSLLRKMRVYNPVASKFNSASRNLPTDSVIEDVFQRSSTDSYFIQVVDVIAHTLYRKEFPKTSLKKFDVDRYFEYFEPILLKEASRIDDLGIVRG